MTINSNILKHSAGLVMWLDAEINSRAGVRDTSINGMQNLVYTPFAGKSNTTGFLEKLNGTATFSDKGVKLGGTCFYPTYQLDDLTVEFCLDLDTYDFDTQFLLSRNYVSGFNVWLSGGSCAHDVKYSVCLQGFNNSKITKQISAEYIKDKKLYFAITTKLNASNSSKLYMNGSLIPEVYIASDGVVPSSSTAINTGVCGTCSTKTTSVIRKSDTDYSLGAYFGEHLNINTLRLWSRQLSEKEILDNYKRDFERFGE